MAVFVPFNPDVHLEEFKQMNIETFEWHCDQLMEHYQVDALAIIGMNAEQWLESNLDQYISLKPPEGVVIILEVNGKSAGMLALTRLNDDVGELHRMWTRPEFRGQGYGRPLLNKVLDYGKEIGYSTFKLSTPKFAYAAQHLYRTSGFKEIEEYSESEVHPMLRQYWIYMEIKE
jgi:ribosomal protein S18 acetylase RimI-like enzyme